MRNHRRFDVGEQDDIIYRLRYEAVFSKLAENSRKIFLAEELTKSTATEIIALMLSLEADDPHKPIELFINCVGGEVESLFAIYDTMHIIRPPIKTICVGEAASSAAVLLAAGTKGMRYAMPNSQIMIHQVWTSGIEGTGTELLIEVKAMKVIKKRLTEILARHCGQTYNKVLKDCEFDKYMSAEEAKEYGLIDEILSYTKEIPELKIRKRKTKSEAPII